MKRMLSMMSINYDNIMISISRTIWKGREPMNTKLNKLLTAFLIVMLALTTLTGCSENAGGNADKPKKDYSNVLENPNI